VKRRGNSSFDRQVWDGLANAIGWGIVASLVYVLFKGKFSL
jgi:hypothetical protein